MIDNVAALSAGTHAAAPSNVGSLREYYVEYSHFHVTALDVAARGAATIRARQNVFSGINRGAEPAYKAALVPLRAELKLLAERWEAYSKHGAGALGPDRTMPPLTEEDALAFFEWADARLDALHSSELELREMAGERIKADGS